VIGETFLLLLLDSVVGYVDQWRVAWYGFYSVEALIVHVVLLDYEMGL
jgi:hypothetical protein